MNILITGCSGFIGSNLSSFLLSHKFNCYALGRHLNKGEIKLIEADLSKPGFLKNIPKDIDIIVHLAQSNLYRSFPENSNDIRKVNIDSTAELLDWGYRNKIKKFIYASTANVYKSSESVINESSKTFPESFYSASKLSAEFLINQYKSYFETYILRIFTPYGPGQNGMLISNIYNNIKNGNNIKLNNKLGLIMTPIFISDLVEIIFKLIISKTKNNDHIEFNVCGNEKVSLFDIVRNFEALLKINAKIDFTSGHVPHFIGSNQKIVKYLDKKNFVSIDKGLELFHRSKI